MRSTILFIGTKLTNGENVSKRFCIPVENVAAIKYLREASGGELGLRGAREIVYNFPNFECNRVFKLMTAADISVQLSEESIMVPFRTVVEIGNALGKVVDYDNGLLVVKFPNGTKQIVPESMLTGIWLPNTKPAQLYSSLLYHAGREE